MNSMRKRLDPCRIATPHRTYLRARFAKSEPATPKIVAAVVAVAFGTLLLLL